MKIGRIACVLAAAFAASSAEAADMLPLKQGIYVPADRPCKGASNADIVNYWGGDSAIGSSQAECKIIKLNKKGKDYTITDRCVDIQSGDEIEGGPTHIIITSSTKFTMSDTAYRYCGTKVQF
jgi:hypothetical protein